MPILTDESMEQLKTGSNYKFSAVKVDQLGATEYTLVTIAQDASGSVCPFAKDMEKCLKTILESCKKSPRAENLLLRLVKFNSSLDELHGFKLLNTIATTDYDNVLNPDGGTALFDAVQSSIEATNDYGAILSDQDFGVNAIVFVITDGDDNESRATPTSVKKAIEKVAKAEKLEQITVVLIGVGGSDTRIADFLTDFQTKAGITQFVNIGDATPSKLAKLANFISRSISSTSKALSNGTSSNLLTF
jgi:uncharacterized protein YegL